MLKHLGFTMLQENSEAKIRVRQMTLVYMPFGAYNLTNNLVGTNLDNLHHLALLGNNLAWVCSGKHVFRADAAQLNDTASRAPAVQMVMPHVKETRLEGTLASKEGSQLAHLLPRVSNLNVPFPHASDLKCTLSTFPPKKCLANIPMPHENIFVRSAL
jgi:hypothetical protein